MNEVEAREQILRTDVEMRAVYKALKDRVQRRLGPFIVVENGPEGGTYWLIDGGAVVEKVSPIDPVFQLAKAVAHIPLGTFSIVAPFLSPELPEHHVDAGDIDANDLKVVASEGPNSDAWVEPILAWQTTVHATRDALSYAGLPEDLFRASARICDATSEFIDIATQSGRFSMKQFEDFTGAVFGDISTNMYWAAKVQIEAVAELMTRWKALLGSQWRDVYVLVYSMWTTSVLNQNTIIIRHFLDPDRVSSHLLDIVADELPVKDPVGVASENLARIIQDNLAGEMVFPTSQTTADALEGKEDLLAQEILRLLGDRATHAVAEVAEASCPFEHRRYRTTATSRASPQPGTRVPDPIG
ncbi:MAG: hypothetical protein H6722_18690 [Sandaracinus sp.]|nr:hypothetical protein [Myxococcales bacterium]MCB9614471.1 hypothetical protein [Sandaracinus sp.]